MEPAEQPSRPSQRTIPLSLQQQLLMGGLVAVVLGVIVFMNMQEVEIPVPVVETNPMTLTQGDTPKGPTTLAAILAQNTPEECTFSAVTDEGVESYGTVYVAEGRMRTDTYTRGAQGPLVAQYVLNDGAYLYLWGDQGEAIKVPVESTQNGAGDMSGRELGVDPTQEMSFDCVATTPAASVFMAPPDITFVDVSLPATPTVEIVAPDVSAELEM